MIPSILHQTWKTADVPERLSGYRATWRTLNPDFEMRLHDDAASRDMVATHYSKYLDLYDNFPLLIQRADLFRYLAVHRFGGFYADLDMECLKPFARWTGHADALFAIERRVTARNQRRFGYAEPYQIGNCIFAAPPGHDFLLAVVERIALLAARRPDAGPSEVEDITGPRMLTRLFYELRPQNVAVLEQVYWLPWLLYPLVAPLDRNMYARHHCVGSWKKAPAAGASWRAKWDDRDLPPNPFPSGPFHRFAGGPR